MKKIIAILLTTLALTAQATSIYPTKANIGVKTKFSNEKIATFVLDNQSKNVKELYKAEIYKWTQDGLLPTTDLDIYPAVVVVQPGKVYSVKVVSNIERTEVQQTYRIIFKYETLKNTENKEAVVSIPIYFSYPIFIEPTISKTVNIESSIIGSSTVFKNSGNATFKTDSYIDGNKKINKLIYILPHSEFKLEGTNLKLSEQVE